MGKIVVLMSVSLDGYFEGPSKELDWQLIDHELHRHMNESIERFSAFLEGRVTHELMAAYWPYADQDTETSEPEKEFAPIWREMPKYVYSSTYDKTDWNTTIVRSVVPEEVMELKSQVDGDMLLGGANLAASFMKHDLIDEFWLYVHPVIIGQGNPLFKGSDMQVNLALVETQTFSSGVVRLRYERPRG